MTLRRRLKTILELPMREAYEAFVGTVLDAATAPEPQPCLGGRTERDDLPLEDMLVALADKLWKGRRVANLKTWFVARLANETGAEFTGTRGVLGTRPLSKDCLETLLRGRLHVRDRREDEVVVGTGDDMATGLFGPFGSTRASREAGGSAGSAR